MTSNTEAARTYLTERRERLRAEIATMQGRMNEIDYLISELDTPIHTAAPRPVILTGGDPPPHGANGAKWTGTRQVYPKSNLALALDVMKSNAGRIMNTKQVCAALEANTTPRAYRTLTASMATLKTRGYLTYDQEAKGYRYAGERHEPIVNGG